MRSEIVSGKLQAFRDQEAMEAEIQSVLMNQTFTDPKDGSKVIRYRCFDPEGVAKVKPIRAVESLINQTKNQVYDPIMSKTTVNGGFGLKKTVYGNDEKNGTGRSSHLLEKIRRNQ